MRFNPLIAFATLLLAASPAVAPALADEDRVRGVVELFTSQGCNSCPKADQVLGAIAREDDVVALAYHVDYWDYRGWRDTLASPDNTERQREYVKALDSRTVYTPQAVINGRAHVNGADFGAVERELGSKDAELPVDVSIRKENGVLTIEVGGLTGPKRNAHVVLVSYDAANPVAIERGENAGKTVTYWNAVRSRQTTGVWHGEPARFEIPMSEVAKKGTGGCAVLVQSVAGEDGPGEILGAAVLPFKGGASVAARD